MSIPATHRIVLVLAAFPVLSETFIVSKFLGLLQAGWDVHIVCTRSDPAELAHFPQLKQQPDVKSRIHRTWPVHPRFIVFLLYPLALIRALLANPRGLLRYFRRGAQAQGWRILPRFYLDFQLLALKPDLIHFEFGAMARGRADLNALLDCKEVVSFRGYDLNFSGLDQPGYYDSVWQHADAFHFLGQDLRQRALRRGCPSQKPYALIPPAIDAVFFSPGETGHPAQAVTPERPFRILSVGRLEWKKGYEFALQAVRELVERGIPCEYRILGGGPYLPALAYARHQLGLEEVVEFLGPQPREQISTGLAWADAFLHAAVSEGFCNAVLEAQAMQVPVVCSDADGLPENVLHGVTGFVVPRRDVRALADHLEKLAASPDLRAEMGREGRQRVISHFQLEDQIKRFASFYTQILESTNAN
ncbi:MAG TPA: glycosyltransferase family 4 protein [Anaerolineales bacterium]|nr:glycosyltransferase family 4 protein [Anaerolineales bacterium]